MTSAVLSKLLGAKPGALGNPVVRAGMNLPPGCKIGFTKNRSILVGGPTVWYPNTTWDR